MAHIIHEIGSYKIAAPYYGALNHPTRGMDNLYFLIDVNPAEKKVAHIHISVWNPTEPGGLENWLKKKGVQLLACSAIDSCHQRQLQNTGIQVQPISGIDIIEELKQWLADANTELIAKLETISATSH